MAAALATELRHLCRRRSITLAVPIEFRVKTWDSIAQKFERANFDMTRIRFSGASLSDLSDLIGIRIIALFARDLAPVQELLETHFDMRETQHKGSDYAFDQFGYASVHSQVKVPEAWLQVPTFAAFRDFEAEVQVRTIAQHMWAAGSHKLQYKHEASVPEHMRRSIHRIASLLETIDAEYERLLVERTSYQKDIATTRSSRRLNTDVLEAILDSVFPAQNRADYEPYGMLVWELEKLGIHHSDALEELIAKHMSVALEDERGSVQQINERAESSGRASVSKFFTHTGLLNTVLTAEYGVGFHSTIFDKVERELSPDADSDA